MVKIPLGLSAYKRSVAGAPEIRQENRYVERSPSNLREQVALITRPGSATLTTLAGGSGRGYFYKEGLFDSDLFAVHGPNLWRYSSDGTKTAIATDIYGTGKPYVTWTKGEGYEYLFIADGLRLRYYNGGTIATGTLTLTPSSPPDIVAQVIQIGSAYYTWSATPAAGTQDGTSANPWKAKKGPADVDSLTNMANLIKFAGVPGTDFSTSLPGPNLDYTAESDATHLYITALSSFESGAGVATTIFSGSHLAWGSATLSGGNVHALIQVVTPGGEVIKALASLAGFALASVGNTRKFFFIEPGDVTIDALNFAEKEASPDNIGDMLTVSDHVFLCGGGSSEDWYATGDADAPFAPIKGQAYERGVIDGTAVVIDNFIVLVGDDNVIYRIGAGGATPISDNAMVERVRLQRRREAGL